MIWSRSRPTSPHRRRHSVEAAVAQAARDVLVARVPAQAASVQSAYDAYMATLPAGLARDGGKAVGAAAATGMLALRTGDRSTTSCPTSRHRPARGLRAHRSDVAGRREAREGKAVHLPHACLPARRAVRHHEQEVRGRRGRGAAAGAQHVHDAHAPADRDCPFFTDPTYVQFSRGLRRLTGERGLDVAESAKLLGSTWVAVADTMIACWEAKYHYLFWRPNHAIQRADHEPRPDLAAARHRQPPGVSVRARLLHRRGAKSLQEHFGTRWLQLTITSTMTGTSRTYTHLDQLVTDVENARVWGGLHYRTTMTETAKHFTRIARDVHKDHFRAEGGNR